MKHNMRSCRRPGRRAMFPVASVAGAAQRGVMFLENMESEELSINGEWPDLKKKIIEKLIAQEYWYKGK